MSQNDHPHPAAAPRVLSFESRRRDEMRSLIERHGGAATVAPSMREVPLEDNAEALEFAAALLAGRIDTVVFMTGVGARALLETVESRYDRGEFLRALEGATIVVRGPKPMAVLREWKVRIDHRAPDPNTWREVLEVLEPAAAVDGKTVAVQEYGQPNAEFYAALKQRGATVLPVPVYRWAFPADPQPLLDAVRGVAEGQFDVLLFTSANQVTNVLQAAEMQQLREAFLAAAGRCTIASIGPTCSDALESAGLRVDVEASPPKMGQLVRQALRLAD